MIVLILAGGGGTRLWPLSKRDFPKQFLQFGDPLSLLQLTVSRFLNDSNVAHIFIATNQQYKDLVALQLEAMGAGPKCQIILEPDRRNTAPAIAFAIRQMVKTYGAEESDSVLILPSDHLIDPVTTFLEYLKNLKTTVQSGRMITFGIIPTKPETGYGYIEIAEKFDPFTYKIEKFIEKPNPEKAAIFASSDRYFWNSGMFFFTIGTFWKQLAMHSPNIYELIVKDGDYSSLPDISVDYALMEKSQDLLICPLPIAWSDVGSWDSVYETFKKDSNQNVKIGAVSEMNTSGCLIFGKKRLIATIGVEDLLIIDTEDALLICKKGESQKVKNLINSFSDICI